MQKIETQWVLTKSKNKKEKETHHLYQNSSNCWWISFTLYNRVTCQSKRFRFSLKTSDLEKAKKRRDNILKDIQEKYGVAR